MTELQKDLTVIRLQLAKLEEEQARAAKAAEAQKVEAHTANEVHRPWWAFWRHSTPSLTESSFFVANKERT